MKLRLARLKVERRRFGERGVKVMAVVGRGKMEDEKKQRDEERKEGERPVNEEEEKARVVDEKG